MSRSWKKVFGNVGFLSWLLIVVATTSAEANRGRPDGWGPYGDGDVFPHSCVNFAGSWKTDEGAIFKITQYKCEYVNIVRVSGWSEDESCIDLLPDNKVREFTDGHYFSGLTRHRWNSLDYGMSIRTWSRYNFADRVIHEEREYEFVNRDMILESTYSHTDIYGGSHHDSRESKQRIFRRVRN